MNPELQWFIAGILENGELPLKTVRELCAKLGSNTDTGSLAQAALDLKTKDMPEEEAQIVLSRFEQLISTASSNAATGELPAPEQLGELPDLNNLSALSDEETANLMFSVLNSVRNMGYSDLHLSAGSPPFGRMNLQIERLGSTPLSMEDAEKLNTALLSEEQKKKFKEEMDLNFALQTDKNRIRASLMNHKEGPAGSYRLVPGEIKSLEELGFSPENIQTMRRLLDFHNGLILVTGPLGSGKTTTLASMVNILNEKRREHVITVEDPIEIVQFSKNCNVTQREIGAHTKSYSAALKGALREDPDVIVIGELHDLETIEMAITAAETGHLVIGTLHTCNAANTLNRVLDVFPPSQRAQIRAMTAGSLRGIICQQLVPSKDGGMCVACELLVNTMAVSNIIGEGKTHQMKAVLQTGTSSGMCTMDHSVHNLYQKGIIDAPTAMYYISDKAHYSKIITS